MTDERATPGPAEEARSDEGDRAPARKRPGRVRRWVVRPVVWVLAVVLLALAAAALYVRSEQFEARVEALVEEQASRALGREVRLEGLELWLLGLGAEARDLRVAGETEGDPPILTARRVSVDLSLLDLSLDLSRGVFRIDRLAVLEPRFELRRAVDGSLNLPRFGDGEGDGRFEVQLGHLLVEDGVFVYDDEEIPLELEAVGVLGQLFGGGAFTPEDPYRVRLSARSMETRLPEAEALQEGVLAPRVSLDASIYPDRLELASGRLEAPGAEVELSGRVRWAGTEEVQFGVVGRVEPDWANRLGYLEEPLSGAAVRFDGQVAWDPLTWSWGGSLETAHLEFLERSFQEVSGSVTGDDRGVRVEVGTARHAGGELSGEVDVGLAEGEAPGRPVRVELRARGLALRQILDRLDLPLDDLAGQLSGELKYRFSSAAPQSGSGRGELRLSRARRPGDRLAAAGTATVRVEAGVLTVDAARVEAPGQRLRADLVYDLPAGWGALRYRIRTTDLGTLATVLPVEPEELGAAGEQPVWWPREGRGTLAGTLDLGPGGAFGRIEVDLTGVATSELSVERLEGSFEHGPEALERLRLRALRGGGELAVTGGVALPEGGPVTLDLTADAAEWPASSLTPLLEAAPAVDGGISGRLEITGELERPALVGHLRAAPLRVAGLFLERAEVDLSFREGVLQLDRASLHIPAGEVVAVGTVDLDSGELALQIDAPSLDLARAEALAVPPGQLKGTLELTATVAGTLDSPQAEMTLRGRSLALEGKVLGREGEAHLVATLDDGRLRTRGSLLGLVTFEGGGPMLRETVDLELQIASEQVERLLELVMEPAPAVAGSFRGTLSIEGALEDPGALTARLRLPELSLTYEGRSVHGLEPVEVALDAESLEIRSFFVGGEEGRSELFLGGTVGLSAEDRYPLDLRVQSTLDVRWLEPFLPDLEAEMEGFLDLLATVRGTLGAPVVDGQGEMRQGQVVLPGFPHSLDRISAIVLLYPDQVVLDSLSGRFAGGRVQAAGRLDLARGEGPPSYSLQARAQGLTVRYPEGWTLRGGAQLSLTAPVEGGGRELRGTVDLERVFYLQDVPIGLFQLIQSGLQRQRLTVQATDEALASTQLSLSVRGEEALRVRNNVADLSGDISLTVQGTLARPVLFGQVEVEPGGTLEFRDNEYEVQRGLLTFSNPYRIEPVIDLVATTEIRRYDVRLNLSGTIDRLNANFASEPPLADLEVLGLLATGSTPQEQRAGQGDVAERFLFGQAASAISRRVNTLFGFDKFSISPGGEGGALSGLGFSVEKSLGRDVTVIVSRGAVPTEGEVVHVAWDVTEGVTLILTREGDGSFAVDGRWEKGF